MTHVLQCDAILFDLDGVLVDSRAVVQRTWQRWAERHGVSDEGLVDRAHGRRSIETVREFAPHLDADEEVRWLAAAELSDFAGVHVLPGAADVTAALRENEWAVVTSGGRQLARERLRHAQLPLPPILIAAEDVPVGKPAPDGYRMAAERLGISTSKCVVIEDTPPGIQAGREAGAQVLALSTTFMTSLLGGADAVVADLRSVRIRRSNGSLHMELGEVAR